MSAQESKFLKYFAAIAVALLITLFGWTYTVIGSVDVIENKVDNNAKGIQETRNYHKADIDNVMFYVKDIRSDQKEIKSDIKELLKK